MSPVLSLFRYIYSYSLMLHVSIPSKAVHYDGENILHLIVFAFYPPC